MDIERAKEKLASVSTGTATRHPKLLIADLCSVVQFLLDALEMANKSKVISLKDLENQSFMSNKKPDVRIPLDIPGDPKYGELKPRKRMGNAGDTE